MMTLATGKSNRHERAFTLIELILVLALLVISVSIVVPRMSGFVRGQALDSEARRLMSLMHAAESRAVSEGMNMALWIDDKQNLYGMEQESPGKSGDLKAQEFTLDSNVKLSIATPGTGAAVTFKNLAAIRFQPDGTVNEGSPKRLKIEDAAGHALWLVQKQTLRGYEVSQNEQ
jgi:type II secretion system protein H